MSAHKVHSSMYISGVGRYFDKGDSTNKGGRYQAQSARRSWP